MRAIKYARGLLAGAGLAVLAVTIAVWGHSLAAHADPAPTISGTVSFNGTPAPLNTINNGVDLTFVLNSGSRYGAHTDANGQYTRDASSFLPGDVNMEVQYNAPYPQENSAVTHMPNSYLLSSTTPVFNYDGSSRVQDLSFATNTVAVTVKNHEGVAVAGRTVQVTNVGNTTVATTDGITFSAPNQRIESQGVTDSNGVATVAVFPGSTYSVCVNTGYIYPSRVCSDGNVAVSTDTTAAVNYPEIPSFSGAVRFNGNPLPSGNMSLTFGIPTVSGDMVVGGTNTDASSNYRFNAGFLFARSYNVTLQYNVPYNQNNSAVTGVPNTFLLRSNTPAYDYGYTNVVHDFSFPTKKLTVQVKDAQGNPVSTHVYVTSTGDNTVTANDGLTFGLPNAQGQSSNPTVDGAATVAIFPGVNYNACALIQNVQYCRPAAISADTTMVLAPAPAAPANLTAPSPAIRAVLSWSASANASSYKVYRDGSYLASTTATAYTDSAAADGTHTYYVTAMGVVESASSNQITVVVDATRPVMNFTAPSSFSGPFVSGPTVTVTGSDATSGLQILVIHIYTGAGQLLNICGTATPAQLSAGTMSCDLSSLAPGTYSVRAGSFDKAGNNRTINSATFTVTGS